jgi:hypothetical protein
VLLVFEEGEPTMKNQTNTKLVHKAWELKEGLREDVWDEVDFSTEGGFSSRIPLQLQPASPLVDGQLNQN